MSRIGVSPANLDWIRDRAAAGASAATIAAEVHISIRTIRRAARMSGIALASSDARRLPVEHVEQLRSLAAQGLCATEIAQRMDRKPKQVLNLAHRLKITVRRMTTQERARLGQARSGPPRVRRSISVPSWVPRDLRGDYRDLACDLGTAWADQAIRRLMEEAQ